MSEHILRQETQYPNSGGQTNQVPPDDNAHSDGLFMHDVTVVNNLLGRYVVRFLDADAGRTDEVSTNEERDLAGRVAAVAVGLRARAARRDRHGDPRPLLGRNGSSDTQTIPTND